MQRSGTQATGKRRQFPRHSAMPGCPTAGYPPLLKGMCHRPSQHSPFPPPPGLPAGFELGGQLLDVTLPTCEDHTQVRAAHFDALLLQAGRIHLQALLLSIQFFSLHCDLTGVQVVHNLL